MIAKRRVFEPEPIEEEELCPAPASKPERFLRLHAVMERTGLARATLYRRIQAGAFPAQVKISARCSAWRESEVEAWMRDPFGFPNSPRDDA